MAPLRIAERALAIGDSLLERGARRTFLLELCVQFCLARSGLADRGRGVGELMLDCLTHGLELREFVCCFSSRRFVALLRIAKGSLSCGNCLLERGTRRTFLLELCVQFCLARSGLADRGRGVGELMLDCLTHGLELCEFVCCLSSRRFVALLRIAKGSLSCGNCLLERGARRTFLLELCVQFCLARSGLADR